MLCLSCIRGEEDAEFFDTLYETRNAFQHNDYFHDVL
jgi:hypothetical protein